MHGLPIDPRMASAQGQPQNPIQRGSNMEPLRNILFPLAGYPCHHSSIHLHPASTFLITDNHITFFQSEHSRKEKVHSASLGLDLNYWSLSLTSADSFSVSWTWFWSFSDSWLFPKFIIWFEIPVPMFKLSLPKQDWSTAGLKISLILCGVYLCLMKKWSIYLLCHV